MQLTLYLVRHAQSQNNALPEPQRVSDPALTELGLLQAEKLSARIENEVSQGNDPDLMLCSPFLRTLQTLQPSAQRVLKKPVIWTELFEAGGCYDGHLPDEMVAMPGMTRAEISQQFPEFIQPADIDESGWYSLDGFEEWAAASERARHLSKKIIDEYYGKHAIVLCMIHGDLIRLILGHYCDGEPVLAETSVSNTSITCLRFDAPDNPPTVLYHDDASHLQASEISY